MYNCHLFCRRLCIKASAVSTGSVRLNKSTPIWVATNPKQRKQLNNVFLDNQGFPDQSDEYDHMLHNIDGGSILRKLRHPQPDLDAPVDPLYCSLFIPEKHKAIIRKDMDLLHFDPDL